MSEDDRGDWKSGSFLERFCRAFPVALKNDEIFRYALILGVIALAVSLKR